MSLATDEGALRSFCARILGWSTERAVAVEHALRSIELAMAHRAAPSRSLEPPPADPCAYTAVDCHEISPRPNATQACSIRGPSR